MRISRRNLAIGAGAAAAGGLVTAAATAAATDLGEHGPLPFYGGFASALRPDLTGPCCAHPGTRNRGVVDAPVPRAVPVRRRPEGIDDDTVDVSNLQRQVIHTTDRVGVWKVDSAEQAIHDLD